MKSSRPNKSSSSSEVDYKERGTSSSFHTSFLKKDEQTPASSHHTDGQTVTAEKLEELSEEDLQAICEALDAAILGNYSTGWTKIPPRKAVEYYFQGALLVPERSVYVVRVNGIIIGSVQLVRPARSNEEQAMSCSLQGFFIAPYTQGLNLTKILLSAAIQAAHSQGFQFLHAEARKDLVKLTHTLHELGFEHWGTNPYYARINGDLVPGFFFTKQLKCDKKQKNSQNEPLDFSTQAESGGNLEYSSSHLRDNSKNLEKSTPAFPSPYTTKTATPTEPQNNALEIKNISMIKPSLTIYPAIDLKDGQCVRLRQGEMEQATIYSDDPAQQAQLWEKSGFEWLHVVDLNGAFAGRSQNTKAIMSILETANIPVQLGGGIRDMEAVHHWIKAGVHRVILGSAAVKNPSLVKEACQAYPGHIVVGIDARFGQVLTEGWAKSSSMQACELALLMQDAGAAAIIFTEISRDGMLTGLDLDQTTTLANSLSIPVIASGGVGSIDDLKALHHAAIEAPGIAGVIIGRALYDGRITPKQALKAMQSC